MYSINMCQCVIFYKLEDKLLQWEWEKYRKGTKMLGAGAAKWERDDIVNDTSNFLSVRFLFLMHVFLFNPALSLEAHFYEKIFTKLRNIDLLHCVLPQCLVHRKQSIA